MTIILVRPPYIDVRGPWPVYVNGNHAIQLTGFLRTITIEDAQEFLHLVGTL